MSYHSSISAMVWYCNNKKIEYGNKTLIMGIVNLTPDSFSDGGSFAAPAQAIEYALQLVRDGADLLDVGAQSTRPGYQEVSPDEEWRRLQPVLSALRGQTAVPLSVDTYYPCVAEKAVLAGADIINDVSGNFQPEMASLIRRSGAGWVVMHNGAGGIREVNAFFERMITLCNNYGIPSDRLCLDPGIGFGKSEEENLALLANPNACKISGFPLLLGASRKRIIGKISGETNPADRLLGNIAADTVAILKGIDIIRLHDVKNEIKGIRAAEELKRWIQ